MCDLCRKEVKSAEHILLLCPWTELVWSDPTLKIRNLLERVTRIDAWLTNFIINPKELPEFEVVAIILWHVLLRIRTIAALHTEGA